MEDYKFIEKIGRGTHGTVYLLKSKGQNKYVVCKSILSKYKNHAYREILILSKLNHKRIAKLVDSVSFKDSVFILLEYINYGSLESIIAYFYKNTVFPQPNLGWSIIAQISDALSYIHSKNIIHRDIKPSNILINRLYSKNKEFLEFKLCDFSLSTKSDSYIDDKHTVGTPYYIAPEMVNKTKYDHTIDVWGLGCCIYELLNFKKPFVGSTREQLFNEISNKEIKDVTEDEALDNLILQCLKKSNRISSKMITKCEKVKLHLAMIELKYKQNRIEELEKELYEKSISMKSKTLAE